MRRRKRVTNKALLEAISNLQHTIEQASRVNGPRSWQQPSGRTYRRRSKHHNREDEA